MKEENYIQKWGDAESDAGETLLLAMYDGWTENGYALIAKCENENNGGGYVVIENDDGEPRDLFRGSELTDCGDGYKNGLLPFLKKKWKEKNDTAQGALVWASNCQYWEKTDRGVLGRKPMFFVKYLFNGKFSLTINRVDLGQFSFPYKSDEINNIRSRVEEMYGDPNDEDWCIEVDQLEEMLGQGEAFFPHEMARSQRIAAQQFFGNLLK